MHSKVTIVVSRSCWQCITCRLVNKHMVSIDGHLKSHHCHLLSLLPTSSPDSPLDSEFYEEQDKFSDLEKTCDENIEIDGGKVMNPFQVQRAHAVKNSRLVQKQETVELQVRRRVRSTKSVRTVLHSSSSGDVDACSKKLNSLSTKQMSTRQRTQGLLESSGNVLKRKLRWKSKQDEVPTMKAKVSHVDKIHADNETSSTFDHQAEKSKEGCTNQLSKSDHENESSFPRSTIYTQNQEMKGPENTRTTKSRLKPANTHTTDNERRKRLGTGLGGKPVKRTSLVTDEEKEKLVKCFVGMPNYCFSEQHRSNTDPSTHVDQLDCAASDCFVSVGTVDCRKAICEGDGDEITGSVHPGSSQLAAIDSTMCTYYKEHQVLSPLMHESSHQSLDRETTNASIDTRSPSGSCTAGIKETRENMNMSKLSGTERSTLYDLETDSQHGQEHINDQSCIEISLTCGSASNVSHTALHLHPQGHSAYAAHEGLPTNVAALTKFGQNSSIADISSVSHSAAQSVSCFTQADVSKLPSCVDLEHSVQAPKGHCSQDEAVRSEYSDDVDQAVAVENKEWMINRTSFSFSNQRPTVNVDQPSEIYKCRVCHAKFSSAKLLGVHLAEMTTDSVRQCKECSKLFHDVYSLNLHVFGDHKKKFLPFCFECGNSFSSMEMFESHLFEHTHNREPELLYMEFHLCQICKTDIPCQYNTLQKHYFRKHQTTLCMECFVRSKLQLLSDAASVKEHRDIHAHFCSQCVQDFPSAESLQAHHDSHSVCQYEEDGCGEVCERCQQWCPNKALTVLHHKEHQLQVMRTWRAEKWGVGFTCIHCEKVLRNKRNLQRHIAQQHSTCRSYRFHCEFCGKGVDSRSRLKDHIALHHLGIKRYSCEFCSERFTCTPTLRRHVLKEHAPDKQYMCEVCSEKFCDKIKLMRHMYIHTGSARFMCEQCGKGFPSSSELKKHAAVHAEKRDFICQGCGQGYKRREHLTRHTSKCSKAVQGKS